VNLIGCQRKMKKRPLATTADEVVAANSTTILAATSTSCPTRIPTGGTSAAVAVTASSLAAVAVATTSAPAAINAAAAITAKSDNNAKPCQSLQNYYDAGRQHRQHPNTSLPRQGERQHPLFAISLASGQNSPYSLSSGRSTDSGSTTEWCIPDIPPLQSDAEITFDSEFAGTLRSSTRPVPPPRTNTGSFYAGSRFHSNPVEVTGISSAEFMEDFYSDGRKDSDLKVFGPKFVQVFEAYRKTTGKVVNLDDHLFTLCCSNLIPFAKWCRDDGKCFIRAVLPDHSDLRCEVRNGLVTVLIYTFSAVKATVSKVKQSDMFKELSNPATGFNIAHKCSIKIYTDPCHYMTFLKLSLSGLINAGILPDNERVNQPHTRRSMDTIEDSEELRMYNELAALLGKYISTDIEKGKRCVEYVVRLWSSNSKVRNFRRFQEAFAAATSICGNADRKLEQPGKVATVFSKDSEDGSGEIPSRALY
jgi:hypothetical protein